MTRKPRLYSSGAVYYVLRDSAGRNDGADFVLMMTKEKAAELGYKPLAQWICGADYGVDPRIMGITPSFFSFKWQKAKSTMKN